jgi:hypothetical protein
VSPLLDADSYALGLVGLPFLIAASALAAVLLYALVMRGASHLRLPMIVFTGGLLPFVASFGLAVGAPDDAAAHAFFRFGTAFVPLGAAGAMVFELALAGRLRAYRIPVAIASVVALGFLGLGLTTDLAVDHVLITPSGLRFFAAGPLVPPASITITAVSTAAFVEAFRAARRATSPSRRRQLWGGLVALAVSFFAMTDVLLAYGVGYAPMSWLFVTIGSLLALRSIFQDDLLRAQSLDSRAPVTFLALSLAGAAAWVLAAYVVRPWPAWIVGVALLLGALGARLTVALVARVWSVRTPGEGPLDRLLRQYAARVRQLTRADEVAALTSEVCQIALGDDAQMIIAGARRLVVAAPPITRSWSAIRSPIRSSVRGWPPIGNRCRRPTSTPRASMISGRRRAPVHGLRRHRPGPAGGDREGRAGRPLDHASARTPGRAPPRRGCGSWPASPIAPRPPSTTSASPRPRGPAPSWSTRSSWRPRSRLASSRAPSRVTTMEV